MLLWLRLLYETARRCGMPFCGGGADDGLGGTSGDDGRCRGCAEGASATAGASCSARSESACDNAALISSIALAAIASLIDAIQPAQSRSSAQTRLDLLFGTLTVRM